MYNSYPEFEGIRLKVDSFITYKDQDSVMPIFFEEQPITWLLFEKEITDLCHKLPTPNILDVGCGSGFWSILLKKKFPKAYVYAIDKNKRAIEYTTLNSTNNSTDINIQEVAFEEAVFDLKFDIIILTPPYHLFPTNRNFKIPFFADGGDLGLTEFYKQLELAFKLLSKNGVILFNQMSVGGDKPSYVDMINKVSQGRSDLHYINILEPIQTKQFIDSLYPINEYQNNISDDIIFMNSDINTLYYTSGIIKNDNSGFVYSYSNYSEYCEEIKKYCVTNKLNYKEPIWEDRVDLHREINSFTPQKSLDILNTNINCYFAKDIDNTTEAFRLSGCDALVNEITKIADIDSFILDFSTIASIIDSGNNALTDFVAVVNNNNDFWSQEENVNIQKKLSANYENVYKPLKNSNIGVYYHPNFFYAPTSNEIHVSMDPNTFGLDLSYKSSEIIDYKFNKISNNTWFSNVSFPLSYDEFINKTREPVYSIKKRCHILHGLYCENYNIKRKNSILICIPLIGHPFYHNNKYNGLGAIFLYIVTSDIKKYTDETIQTIANRLSIIGKDITYAYSFNIGKTLADNVTKEAIKSAKAAIMSRNMSHNLGSHYIANTKNYISNLANSKNDQDLRGLSHLLQYIQERMDYIATVISNDVYPLGSLNFKSQIFDELTIDDCGERHGVNHKTTNFLLKYIVFSEKYTRTNSDSIGLKNLKIEINYPITIKDPITNEIKTIDKIFTGKSQFRENENNIKLKLSKLNIAVPCGIMARHALFNIIENIIRNSAKHNKKTQGDLVIRIVINEVSDGKFLKISIHDNRGSYNELIGNEQNGVVAQRLSAIRFLEEGSSELNKENKGLKEMMISALWLKNENVGDVMSEIDATANGEEKYKLIAEKCLQIEPSTNGDLAYTITLPIYQEMNYIADSFSVEELKDIHADVIVGTKIHDKNKFGNRPFDSIFSRYLVDSTETKNMSNVEKLKKTIFDNLGVNVDDYKICIDSGKDAFHYSDAQVTTNLPDEDDKDMSKKICFITHFDVADDNSKKETLLKYNKLAYLDSISGENFTSTLVTPDFMNDEYLRCKVIESALTNIAIIDERIYEKFAKNDKQMQQSFENGIRKAVEKRNINTVSGLIEFLKGKYPKYFTEEIQVINNLLNNKETNTLADSDTEKAFEILFPKGVIEHTLNKRGIFVYSIEADENQDSVLRSVSGVNTKLGNSKPLADALFLTIHLGLVEKYKYDKDRGGVTKLMNEIRTHFPKAKYISVHSGRGNFSAELSVELKDYCFITLSALEAAVNNSKYMLSQLFYNMNYYGKGNINND